MLVPIVTVIVIVMRDSFTKVQSPEEKQKRKKRRKEESSPHYRPDYGG